MSFQTESWKGLKQYDIMAGWPFFTVTVCSLGMKHSDFINCDPMLLSFIQSYELKNITSTDPLVERDTALQFTKGIIYNHLGTALDYDFSIDP